MLWILSHLIPKGKLAPCNNIEGEAAEAVERLVAHVLGLANISSGFL